MVLSTDDPHTYRAYGSPGTTGRDDRPTVRRISRNGRVFKSWPPRAEDIAHAVCTHSAILDGEICCLAPDGISNFRNRLFRREWPYFYAFDLLTVDGRDMRAAPLTERKAHLRQIMPRVDCWLLFLDAIAERGRDLFRLACRRDLEGVVAKWAHGTYQTDGRSTSWIKVKNPDYSQIIDRHELFDRRSFEGATRRRFAAPFDFRQDER